MSALQARGESLSGRLAAFMAELSLDDMPADVVRLARLHLADALGVGLGAASVAVHRRWLQAMRAGSGSAGASTVLGFATGADAPLAALLNGTSIHSLEYDDTHMASIVHGSAVIVPAALASAEAEAAGARGRVDELVRRVAAGWEILVRIGEACPGGFQRRGLQVTSVAGVLVAALLASVSRGAGQAQSVAAMGIAGSMAGGLFEFLSNGSNVKALHPGWAAHGGVWAAASAAAGMTGPDTVLEGRFGLYAAYADDRAAGERLAAGLADLGRAWRLSEAAFKLFPCCHYIHPYLECGQELRRQGADADTIASVRCLVAPGAAPVIAEPWADRQRVSTARAAQYSLPYCLARVLLGRPVDLAAMTAERLDADALALAQRIESAPWPDSGFPDRFGADVQVGLKDGRTLRHRVEQVRGSAQRPVDESVVRAKFDANAAASLRPDAIAAVWDRVNGGATIGELQQALRRAAD